MGVEAPAKRTAKSSGGFDAGALARALAALAPHAGDRTRLGKEALALLKRAFTAARADVRTRFEAGAISGVEVGRALSALQDDVVRTLYDFATRHVYVTANPTSAEHLAVVATGGYGRGLLAPHSDIDLLFLRPYKQTPWGEKRHRIHPAHAVGSGAEGRPRDALGRRMRAPGQGRSHHPHRAVGSAPTSPANASCMTS